MEIFGAFKILPFDIILIVFFLLITFIYGMTIGKDKLLIINTGIYIALAIVSYAPFINSVVSGKLGFDSFFIFKLTVFWITFFILFFLLSKSTFLIRLKQAGVVRQMWYVFVFSILHVGLLISVSLSILPNDLLESFSGISRFLFANNIAVFIWLVAPIVFLAVLREDADEDD